MICEKHEDLFNSIHHLRDVCWLKAIKYQYDPVLSKAHKEYLEALNIIIDIEKGEGVKK